MRPRISTWAVLAAIALAGCKPEPFPEQVTSSPTFHGSGTVDGQPISFVAGENGTYLHTDAHIELDESRLLFTALEANGCTECPHAWTFELQGESAWVDGEAQTTEEMLSPGTFYDLNSGNTSSLVFGDFTEAWLNENVSVTVEGETLFEPVYVMEQALPAINTNMSIITNLGGFVFYDVTMELDGSGCDAVERVIPGLSMWQEPGGIYVELEGLEEGVDASFTLPLADITGNLAPNGITFIPVDSDLIAGSLTMEFAFAEAGADQPFGTAQLVAIPGTFETFNFPLAHLWSQPIQEEARFSVGLHHNDHWYQSSLPCEETEPQSEGNHFEILEVESFQVNEQGMPTYKVKASIQADLFNTEMPWEAPIHLVLDELVIAFASPED